MRTFHQARFTYRVEDSSGLPCTVTVNGQPAERTSYTYAPESAGEVILHFQVSNGKSTQAYDVPIRVLPNTPPALPLDHLDLPEGMLWSGAALAAQDEDGDTVTWTLKSDGLGNAATLRDHWLSIGPNTAPRGSHAIVLTATESGGTLVKNLTQDLTLQVNVVLNTSPSGIRVPPSGTSIPAGSTYTYVLQASSPLLGDPVKASGGWLVDGGAPGLPAPAQASVNDAGGFTWTPSPDLPSGTQVTFGFKATFVSGIAAYGTTTLVVR